MRNDTSSYSRHSHHAPTPTIRVALVFAMILTIACSSGDQVTAPTVETHTIGPNGGTVTDKGGARVTVPPGALTAETEIEVASLVDADACPAATGPVPAFVGGGEFEPHGLQFAIPATVTIPSNCDLTPGSTFPLFVWNEAEMAWAQTEFMATVAADGRPHGY